MKDARVLMIGAGGLGVPAVLSLASHGIGRVTILDPDRVELSNLHRQFLYREADVGRSKAEAIAAALQARFPDLSITSRAVAFSAELHDLVIEHDVVLDGTDQFETKLAISDACVDRGVPYVFAGVVGYEGQVLACRPGASACVRCFFDEAPPPGGAPTCAELGILGPIAGIVGARQAACALALLQSDDSVLDNLWVYDGSRDRARSVPLRRAGDCKGCGPNKHLRGARAPLETLLAQLDAPVVDLSGEVCPATYTLTRRALEKMPERARVWIHLTSDEAARSVPKSALAAGHKILAQTSDGKTHRVLIERGGGSPMAITIRIPSPLRQFTQNKDTVQITSAQTVGAALEELEKAHPGLKERLFEGSGKLRRFVNVYYNDEDIRFLENVDTKIADGSEISIVPAIAGGV